MRELRDEHGHDPSFGLSAFLPVHGDDVLPAAGSAAGVDVLVSTCRVEMALYLVATGDPGWPEHHGGHVFTAGPEPVSAEHCGRAPGRGRPVRLRSAACPISRPGRPPRHC